MTIYIYVKTHLKTSLKYLGKTKNNPYEYPGSGKYWREHIRKHGNDVWTNIIYQSDDAEDISKIGIYLSEKWNVVDSEYFANLIPENGSGGGVPGSDPWNKGKKIGKQTKEHISKRVSKIKGRKNPGLSLALKGKTRHKITCSYCGYSADPGNYAKHHSCCQEE